ncbi:MAG TPA: flagellar motor stator protein MotA [Pirellula sp.]|nr:flagellar motor stator protein MotA [Pirellula sp.]
MVVIIGCIVVTGSVIGGFLWAGGEILALNQPSEFVTIGGASLGALIVMSPFPVLKGIVSGIIQAIKGAPYSKKSYEETFSALYELFRIARRDGLLALEGHVADPHKSVVFAKYPKLAADHHATEFIKGAFGPVIDGSVRPEDIGNLMEIEIGAMETEHHHPVDALSKTADALPGFGIVAAVLGIVVTMGHIDGPPAEIGHHVGAALVGTFLGILASYGFIGPLVVKMGNIGHSEAAYFRTIACVLQSFFNGMQPKMAIETGRRGLESDVRPSAEEVEKLLKTVDSAGA